MEKLCDYLEAHHKFFQKGFRWLNQMLPDIYEYRLFVERVCEREGGERSEGGIDEN